MLFVMRLHSHSRPCSYTQILHLCCLPAGGLSFTATLLLANATCAAWLAVYHWLLEAPEERAAQVWRHDSSDWAGAAPAAQGGPSEAQSAATSGGGRAAEQQRRRQEGGGRGPLPQVPVLAEAAQAVQAAGEADLQGAQGSSEEQRRLLGEEEGGRSDLQRQQQWHHHHHQQQQQQGQQRQQGQQLDAGMLEEGSEEWKPSKAGRMAWRERLHRTGKRMGLPLESALCGFGWHCIASVAVSTALTAWRPHILDGCIRPLQQSSSLHSPPNVWSSPALPLPAGLRQSHLLLCSPTIMNRTSRPWLCSGAVALHGASSARLLC